MRLAETSMIRGLRLRWLLSILIVCWGKNVNAEVIRYDGYRGIWFDLRQKYSGGLGTYTAKHNPLAVYAPDTQRTYFVWGGTSSEDERKLRLMLSYYDHRTGTAPRPAMVFDKGDVDDPHDNPALQIDDDGYLWFFVAGRGTTRPGYIYRSREPHSIEAFDSVRADRKFAYPQPWYVSGRGFVVLYTEYGQGRELFWRTSADGYTWSEHRKLAGFGGHYQVSWCKNGRIFTAFNYHINGVVDTRTNLYFLQSSDFGASWQTASGETISPPLATVDNAALVRDYHSEGLLVYCKDVNFDVDGNPVILHITSSSAEAGVQEPPRSWMTAHWSGREWQFRRVTDAYHNYDMGSLYIEDGLWRIIAPTEPGPQPWGTGGEVAVWTSEDQGVTWRKERNLTAESPRNHSYVRRPLNADPGFYGFWADGDAHEFSVSRLYFTSKDGAVYQLPAAMESDTATPLLINGATSVSAAAAVVPSAVNEGLARGRRLSACELFDIRGRRLSWDNPLAAKANGTRKSVMWAGSPALVIQRATKE